MDQLVLNDLVFLMQSKDYSPFDMSSGAMSCLLIYNPKNSIKESLQNCMTRMSGDSAYCLQIQK